MNTNKNALCSDGLVVEVEAVVEVDAEMRCEWVPVNEVFGQILEYRMQGPQRTDAKRHPVHTRRCRASNLKQAGAHTILHQNTPGGCGASSKRRR